MKTRTWIILAAVALVALLAFTLTPAAWAQGPAGAFGPRQMQGRMAGGRGNGGQAGQMGGPQQSLVGIAAQQLGLERTDLVAQLQAGKTIAQVAGERNVAPDTIVNAFVAERQARMAQAVANGRMTQAEADAMLATARATATARLSEPWSPRGPGAGAGNAGKGDGTCGAGQMRGRMGR
jgi:hypothetical protein